jgi:hypothetical protein
MVAGTVLVISTSHLWAVGNVSGHGRFERIKGKPHMGYVELYETNLFLSPAAQTPLGPSRRLGTTCEVSQPGGGITCSTQIITGDGCYCIYSMPAGNYSVFMNQPLFFICPKVVPNVTISNNQTLHLNPELPIEFSTFFKNSNQWTGPDTVWYQTFTATGTGVRGVAFSCAGSPSPSVEVAILRDNGSSDVRNWQLVNSRIEPQVGQDTDNWVRFRSQEVPLTPGTRYAVRLTSRISGTIQPYKRDKDANSYAGGRAYNGAGVAQNFDLNVTVFGDTDGTLVTMNKRTTGLGWLCDNGYFGQRWGQTFVAHGGGLAGADVWAAGASNKWELQFLWKVRQGGPTGQQIGPTKITNAAFQSFGAGLHAVSYNPGEVPLIAGQTYFIEFNIHNPPPESNGFNPYLMHPSPGATCNGGDDPDWFEEGIAYRDNEARPNDDLSMTIVEYAVPEPLLEVAPETLNRTTLVTNNLPNDSFTVRNGGSDSLNYSITDNAAWLSASPASGSSSGETDTITILYNTAGLPLGQHTATITISSPQATNSPQTIGVTVTVRSVGPDFDKDLDVDQTDFGFLQKCYTGAGFQVTDPICVPADLDQDEDVDQSDFGILQGCLSGANQPANQGCEP